eukprot:Unigene15595_Nuclearia_a/m.46527 Unigene15595_Nuclearia_a/g.46527  ORF Unigene15595_Nuclearia_a/g.46527 Unigene15595_Nuclearia_a/m.46527 type:complete len:934 (+) Unigene15595_Nuclearia_a:25-2826(+)
MDGRSRRAAIEIRTTIDLVLRRPGLSRERKQLQLRQLCEAVAASERTDESMIVLEAAVDMLQEGDEELHMFANYIIETMAQVDTGVFLQFFTPPKTDEAAMGLLGPEHLIPYLRLCAAILGGFKKLAPFGAENASVVKKYDLFVHSAVTFSEQIIKLRAVPGIDNLRATVIVYFASYPELRPRNSLLLPFLIETLNLSAKMEHKPVVESALGLIRDVVTQSTDGNRLLLHYLFETLSGEGRVSAALAVTIGLVPQSFIGQLHPLVTTNSGTPDGRQLLGRFLSNLLSWLSYPLSNGISPWVIATVREISEAGLRSLVIERVTTGLVERLVKSLIVETERELKRLTGRRALDSLLQQPSVWSISEARVVLGAHAADQLHVAFSLLLGTRSDVLLEVIFAAVLKPLTAFLERCQMQLSMPLVMAPLDLSLRMVAANNENRYGASELMHALNTLFVALLRLYHERFAPFAGTVIRLFEQLGIRSPSSATIEGVLEMYRWPRPASDKAVSQPPTARGIRRTWDSQDRLNETRVGLVNLGNTCFMNSIVVALYANLAFRHAVFNGRSAKSTSFLGLQHLFGFLSETHRSALVPRLLYESLPPYLRTGAQQDSMECLQAVLADIERDLTVAPSAASQQPTSRVHEIFGGSQYNRASCERGHMSLRTEPITSLTVYFAEKHDGALDLASLVKAAWDPEQLVGDNQYMCDKCGRRVDGQRHLGFDKAPKYLAVQLGRFQYDVQLGRRRKIMTAVSIPYVLSSVTYDVSRQLPGTVSYTPYAVVVHEGQSADAGHYYCYARETWPRPPLSEISAAPVRDDGPNEPSRWHVHNDEQVSEVGHWDDVVRAIEAAGHDHTPYIVFFQQVTEPREPVRLSSDMLPATLAEEIRRDNQAWRASKRAVTLPATPTAASRFAPPPPPPSGAGAGAGMGGLDGFMPRFVS